MKPYFPEEPCTLAAFDAQIGSLAPSPGTKINMSVTARTGPQSQTTQIKNISCSPSRSANSIDSLDGRLKRYNGGTQNMNDPIVADFLAARNHFAGNHTMTPIGKFTYTLEGGATGTTATCSVALGNIAVDTRFNTQRDNYARAEHEGPVFGVSQDLLNEALFNSTISAALQLGYWNTAVTINATDYFNVYSFASPKQLLIPYLACLGISVSFLLLGLFSLHQNGASTIQDGFLQMLTTTIGSDTLREAAAGSSLGGEENVPEELKRLKIRYGELIHSRPRRSRRLLRHMLRLQEDQKQPHDGPTRES
ncbi:hypothetical protein GQ44DRAFT_764181 [Phaeosphaeriaceae sp. PMI808]|nr:hypothetical protein GQ44DRAFT_764181 [Phaeosphaeriaceae sp. PMI808]